MAVKKSLLSVLLVFFLGVQLAVCNAQEQVSIVSVVPWPLYVARFEIHLSSPSRVTSTATSTKLGGNMHASGNLSNSPLAGGQQKVSFVLKAKNPSSDKTIKQIQWESSFLDTQNQPVKNTFNSKKKIKPSKEETIEEILFFNISAIPSKINLGFRIRKIEYEDNSIWENKVSNADSDFVFEIVNVD